MKKIEKKRRMKKFYKKCEMRRWCSTIILHHIFVGSRHNPLFIKDYVVSISWYQRMYIDEFLWWKVICTIPPLNKKEYTSNWCHNNIFQYSAPELSSYKLFVKENVHWCTFTNSIYIYSTKIYFTQPTDQSSTSIN